VDAGIVLTIARKEIRDSLRNRWLLLYAVAFAVLSFSLSYLSLAGSGSYGVAGFGRTAAGLVNLVLLIVPLMALTVGAGSVAGDAERGSLGYLLSQPVRRAEVLLGKYAGLAFAMVATLALGFGGSGAVMARGGAAGDVRSYTLLVALSFVLALAMLSVGFLISVLTRKASVALGVALFLWLALAFFSDLGLMGGTLAFKLHVSDLFRLALVNPLQVFKMAVLGSIHATLDVLGPAGFYATQKYGDALGLIFGISLALWILVPLGLAVALFGRKGEG
jgi:Cu-processing system permease protein